MLPCLAACVTAEPGVETPSLVSGTVAKPRYTGWRRDWCSAGEPVRELSCQGDETSVGGEIYRSILKDGKSLAGSRLPSRLVIGYPAHSLSRGYRASQWLMLQAAPKDFRDATGIDLLAVDYGMYDEQRSCMVERGYGHADGRDCRDRAFHIEQQKRCVPVNDFLAHYAARP
jgi:hypothetical protein